MDWFAKEHNIQSKEDWNTVTREQLLEAGGNTLLRLYGSVQHIIGALYMKNDVSNVGNKLTLQRLAEHKNYRKFLDEFAEVHGIKVQEDWYDCVQPQIVRMGGRFLLDDHQNSHIIALEKQYPEYLWYPWLFIRAPPHFWKSLDNQRRYLDWLAEQLDIRTQSDWYPVKFEDVTKLGGYGLLIEYGGSLQKALKQHFPELTWHPWFFDTCPRNYWRDMNNIRTYMVWLSNHLGITDVAEWGNISPCEIKNSGGVRMLKYWGGLPSVLSRLFPDRKWDSSKRMGKSEFSVLKWIKILFPNNPIIRKYKHPQLVFSNTGQPMELDIFIPSLSLAFEYQGVQHYNNAHYLFGNSETLTRDSEKQKACATIGITLIEVPWWWDYSKQSLQATISQKRKDITFLESTNCPPIPPHPPMDELYTQTFALYSEDFPLQFADGWSFFNA